MRMDSLEHRISKLSFSRSHSSVCHPTEAKVKSLLEKLSQKEFKNVIVLSGAGCSTGSGIPDFRTPETGLYANCADIYKVDTPEDLFDLHFFRESPKPFFRFLKDLMREKPKPNVYHQFIRLLNEEGMMLRNYTQNIDGLEEEVGIPQEKLVYAHGSLTTATCVKCGYKTAMENIIDDVMKEVIPICSRPKCWGVFKPDVVFFGEALPPRFHQLHRADLALCDLLIVAGTSLEVKPVGSIPRMIAKGVPTLLLNDRLVGKWADGFTKDHQSDAAMVGDLAQTVPELTRILGWDTKMENLQKKL